MKLPALLAKFLPRKAQNESYYLGLFLKEEEGIVLYIKKEGSRLNAQSFEKFKYSNGWENLTEDLDEVLFRLEKETKKSPDEVILFLYSYLIDEDSKQIKKPYIDKIKAFIKNLDLKPLGYIDAHEAVAAGIEKREDMPLTGILIELDKSNLQIFIYKGGKNIYKEHIVRSHNILEDVIPSFEHVRARFVLPSRIILYDSGHLDVESGKILTHHWKEDFFIQLPKVEIVKPDVLIDDLLEIFSSQLLPDATMEPKKISSHSPENPKEVMGFVIGGEIPEVVEEEKPHPPQHAHANSPTQVDAKRFTLPVSFSKYLNMNFLKSKLKILKSLPFPVLPLIGIVLVLAALFVTEYYFHKASITLYLPSQSIDEKVSLVAATNDSKEVDLKLTSTEKESTFKDQKATTGKREIGKKAQGIVTLHNFSDEEKTFSKNTTLAADDLVFTLLDDVKVASSSLASDASAKLPGKKDGSVEAEKIGSEYNLEKGKRFSIGDLSKSTYFGINESSLAGGEKKEILTVSKEDLDTLKKNTLKKADAYVGNNIKTKLDKNTRLLSNLTEKEITVFTPSAEVGEEANSVKADSKVTIVYFTYQNKDLLKYLAQSLQDKAKSNLTVTPERVSYSIQGVKKNKNNTFALTMSARARATEEIDKKKIAGSLVGKKTDELDEMAKKEYKATELDVEVSHPLGFLTVWLPFFQKNIQVQINYR